MHEMVWGSKMALFITPRGQTKPAKEAFLVMSKYNVHPQETMFDIVSFHTLVQVGKKIAAINSLSFYTLLTSIVQKMLAVHIEQFQIEV